MNDGAEVFAQRDGGTGEGDLLHYDIPDAALEAAAGAAAPGGAMSFPNAPTVSILVMCCSFEGS